MGSKYLCVNVRTHQYIESEELRGKDMVFLNDQLMTNSEILDGNRVENHEGLRVKGIVFLNDQLMTNWMLKFWMGIG